jgi:hypothetical protein
LPSGEFSFNVSTKKTDNYETNNFNHFFAVFFFNLYECPGASKIEKRAKGRKTGKENGRGEKSFGIERICV